MFERVTGAFRGIFSPKKKVKLNDPRRQKNKSSETTAKPPTKEQLQHEAQRQRANADTFISNGILVETISRGGECEEDDLETGEGVATSKANNKATTQHPYNDRNRMNTVMEPIA